MLKARRRVGKQPAQKRPRPWGGAGLRPRQGSGPKETQRTGRSPLTRAQRRVTNDPGYLKVPRSTEKPRRQGGTAAAARMVSPSVAPGSSQTGCTAGPCSYAGTSCRASGHWQQVVLWLTRRGPEGPGTSAVRPKKNKQRRSAAEAVATSASLRSTDIQP